MIVAINYSDWKYKKAQKFNSITATQKGKVDKVISYSPKNIDTEFRKKNASILSQDRGNGFWLWKPYIIKKTLDSLQQNDYLIYLDSGAFYMNNVQYLIKVMEKEKQDIMAFELPFKERHYSKRDVFICMGCDEPRYTDTNQRMATMIIIKKTNRAQCFTNEWLQFAQMEDIITDAKNHMGKYNYNGFVDNRHDQSVFSILSKKYKIKAFRDPSQYGRFPKLFWSRKIEVSEDATNYPQIIAEHRFSEVTKGVFWEQMLFAYAPEIFLKYYLKFGFSLKARSHREKIAILTDNMPIKESAYGFGMYKVVNRLVMALKDDVDTIICTDNNFQTKNIEAVLENKIVLSNKFHSLQNNSLADIGFLMEICKEIYKLKNKGIRKLFIPLGADYRELKRAYLCSRIYHLSVSIYIVDDFLEYNRIFSGTNIDYRGLKKDIINYLKEIDCIFVISKGMQDRIYDLTGRRSVLLPIPYENKKIFETSERTLMQVLFLGSINRLYVQGIKDMAEVIDELNKKKNLQIRFQFTYKSIMEVKQIIGNYKCIISRHIGTEVELKKEMRDSIFCFMPYSDDKDLNLMQNTSFPSKLVEYMSSARSIVIYGNNENLAKRYFEENNLPQIIQGRDTEMLERCILEHIEQKKDYSKRYNYILNKNHSFKSIRRKIQTYI
ncbi:MAG: hypothetical protein OSJ73_05650 [Lachnospiraceae bacterium]|nr:hypothetical protein [Lachnospiraceae bacterium]